MTYRKYREYVELAAEEGAIIAQLAEESAEVSQACIKLLRAKRIVDSPTPVTVDDAYWNLVEEIADCMMCYALLSRKEENRSMADNNPKWVRWAERLGYID